MHVSKCGISLAGYLVCEGIELFPVPEKPQHLSLFSSPPSVIVPPTTTNISFQSVEMVFVLKSAEEYKERSFWSPFVRFLSLSFSSRRTPSYIKNLLHSSPSLSRNNETLKKVEFIDTLYKNLRKKLKIGVNETSLGVYKFDSELFLSQLHPKLGWEKAKTSLSNISAKVPRGTVFVADENDFPIMSAWFGNDYYFQPSASGVEYTKRGWGYEEDSRYTSCCFVWQIFFYISRKGRKVEVKMNSTLLNSQGRFSIAYLRSLALQN